jgi:8-oxo-dGTP pyrophosphatase MutT (NUDIX family)
MALIQSAGAVLYTLIDGVRHYVLVREKNGSYGLPKGHVEPGETLAQTALREIREETGLTAMLHAFTPAMVDEYPIAGGDTKRVSWFVARYADQTPSVDRTQVLGVLVMPIEAALKTLTYGSTREILRTVDQQLDAL